MRTRYPRVPAFAEALPKPSTHAAGALGFSALRASSNAKLADGILPKYLVVPSRAFDNVWSGNYRRTQTNPQMSPSATLPAFANDHRPKRGFPRRRGQNVDRTQYRSSWPWPCLWRNCNNTSRGSLPVAPTAARCLALLLGVALHGSRFSCYYYMVGTIRGLLDPRACGKVCVAKSATKGVQ